MTDTYNNIEKDPEPKQALTAPARRSGWAPTLRTDPLYVNRKTMERKGEFIQTYSGVAFYPLDPSLDDIYIGDIAHSLSMKCRYGGHTTKFYSVAEHSILVSELVPPQFALWGLLHDAPEAYTADVPRPLKRMLAGWDEMEARIMDCVCERFGLDKGQPPQVSLVDLAITSDEKDALMMPCEKEWEGLSYKIGAEIVGYNPDMAKHMFLKRFKELTE